MVDQIYIFLIKWKTKKQQENDGNFFQTLQQLHQIMKKE